MLLEKYIMSNDDDVKMFYLKLFMFVNILFLLPSLMSHNWLETVSGLSAEEVVPYIQTLS